MPPAPKLCDVTREVRVRKVLHELEAKQPSDAKGNVMLFRLFHGVYLPAGLSVKVDKGSSSRIVFQKSDRFGVYAALPLKNALANKMSRGGKLHIGLQVNKGKTIDVAASLKGFKQALVRINALN